MLAESARPLVALVWLMVGGSCHACPATPEASPIGLTKASTLLCHVRVPPNHSTVIVPWESEESL